MHPLYSEILSQQQRLEMLQQAEHERLAMAVRRPEHSARQLHRTWAYQLGSMMVKWGYRLERFGTSHRVACSASQQHH
ncbi:MAG TPA: hypothetical protein VKY19_11675 [Ktedonosporobacter sp.]|nr:hypothetical protein [Ktedonosporobacter sp.]